MKRLHILDSAVLLLLGLMMVAACQTPIPAQTPQQIIFAAEGAEIVAIRGATIYKQLPLCGPMGPVLCSTAENVAKLDQAIRAADAAVESAKVVVRDPAFTSGPAAQSAAIAAQEAVNALTAIVAIYNKQ